MVTLAVNYSVTNDEAIKSGEIEQWKRKWRKSWTQSIETTNEYKPRGGQVRRQYHARWYWNVNWTIQVMLLLIRRFLLPIIRWNHDVHYDETFTPVVPCHILILMLGKFISLYWRVHRADISTTFPNGDIHAEIYVSMASATLHAKKWKKECMDWLNLIISCTENWRRHWKTLGSLNWNAFSGTLRSRTTDLRLWS